MLGMKAIMMNTLQKDSPDAAWARVVTVAFSRPYRRIATDVVFVWSMVNHPN